MDKKLLYKKAVMLLDAGKDEEAVKILKEVLASSTESDDYAYLIRSANILGEYYYHKDQKKEAADYFRLVINNKDKDEDLIDMVGFEIGNAEKLLSDLT